MRNTMVFFFLSESSDNWYNTLENNKGVFLVYVARNIFSNMQNDYDLISVKKWLKRKNMIEITHKIIHKKIRLFLCAIIHII